MSLEFYARDLRLATEQLTGEAINAALAKFARDELGKAISGGEASDQFDRFVNAQRGLSEEAVIAPGPIVYVFNDWPVIIASALGELQKRAPRRSGKFASSFIAIVKGRIATDFRSIGADDEVIITNFRPYIRHVEAGNLGVPRRRQFDGTKNWLSRKYYGVIRAETRFLSFQPGVHAQMPYILKTGGRVRLAAKDLRSSAYRAGRTALTPRADRMPGQAITYPAIIMNMV
jgi:hypothetical protein